MPLTVIAHTAKALLEGTGPGRRPSIETIILDANLREVHAMIAQPVRHPVEPDDRGSVVDHIVNEPRILSLDCIVTNTPTYDPPSHADGAVAGPQIVTPFSSLIDDPGTTLTNRLGAADASLGLKGQLQPGLPTVGLLQGFTPAFDRRMAVWEELQGLHKAKALVVIATALELYTDMLMLSISVPVTSEDGGSLRFSVTAEKVEKVGTRTVDAPRTSTDLVTGSKKVGAKATKPVDSGPGEDSSFPRNLVKSWQGN